MEDRKLPLSFCVGDFYLIGKVGIKDIKIDKKENHYDISFSIEEGDIKRLDDPEFTNTETEARSNVLQIDFNTGEKKWI